MYAPIQMHEISFWKVVENSPEWVTVFSTFLFAGITAAIIWRQKCVMDHQATIMQQQKDVMEKQGEISARHERMQNRLLQLQHEHEWLTALNARRYEILRTASQLHVDVLYIIRKVEADRDAEVWADVMKGRSQLRLQMDILDVAAYTDDKDGWYTQLASWASELFGIISEELKSPSYNGIPTDATRKALQAAETPNPIVPIYLLQTLIRESTDEFSKKWIAETAKV
jgi:hypothetical protein